MKKTHKVWLPKTDDGELLYHYADKSKKFVKRWIENDFLIGERTGWTIVKVQVTEIK